MRHTLQLVLAILCAAVLAACSPSTGPNTADDDLLPTAEPTREPVTELDGTSWLLSEIRGSAPIVPMHFILTFDPTHVSGKTCTPYGGTYTIPAPGALAISDLLSAETACAELANALSEIEIAGVLEQESVYLTAL